MPTSAKTPDTKSAADKEDSAEVQRDKAIEKEEMKAGEDADKYEKGVAEDKAKLDAELNESMAQVKAKK